MRSLLPAALVAAALAALPAALPTALVADAVAAAATCQGRSATVEGDTGTLVGTPGDDVVVARADVHRVDTGEGNDVVCVVATTSARLVVTAGAGDDLVDTTAAGSASTTLLGTGADTFAGGSQPDQVSLEQDVAAPSVRDLVRTGGGDDSLSAGRAPVDADLGPGDDDVTALFAEGQSASTVELGTGRDEVTVRDTADLTVDLRAGTLLSRGVTSVVSGGEDLFAEGATVVVRGSSADNDVAVSGCRVTVRGGRGDDELAALDAPCSSPRARLYGQAGRDTLRGSSGEDVLLGGAGADSANGRAARDRCVAERERKCER